MPSRPRNYQTRRMPQEQAQTPTPTPAPAPTPAIVPPVTNTGGVMGPQAPVQGVRGDQDLFNRLFGKLQEGGGYVADQTIANTMQNRNILPAPISYTGSGLSPNIQRRADLMSASNPADALRNPPAGPAMARDNGQAIARNTPNMGLFAANRPNTPSAQGGKKPRPPQMGPIARPTGGGKMPRGGQ
jgi:hypothetical protein